jgi:hypothetical protein
MFKNFLNFFSIYVNPFEKRVDKFFLNIPTKSSRSYASKQLIDLMQKDLVVLSLFLEHRFKGYKNLYKSNRELMYGNVEYTKMVFLNFCKKTKINESILEEHLDSLGYNVKSSNLAKLKYLYLIMLFLKPGRYYKYEKAASFSKLLADIKGGPLIGDCNQIVTLYTYLYSIRYNINDLKIKLLPGHVCLHFEGIDLEATTGEFKVYKSFTHLLPITEIVSTNLLDVTDATIKKRDIGLKYICKSADLAFAISSLRELVEKNLDIAYTNLVLMYQKEKKFSLAIKFAKQSKNLKLLNMVYHNASIDALNKKKFVYAFYYARLSGDEKLKKSVKHNEGVYCYNKNNYKKALSIFKGLGDTKMQKACYIKEYNALLKEVKHVKDVRQARLYKSKYRKMYNLAVKMGDKKLARGMQQTLSQI